MTQLQIHNNNTPKTHQIFLPSSMRWQAMNDLYKRLLDHWPFHKTTESAPTHRNANINICEDKQAYKMSVKLSGLDFENVDLDLSDNVLIINGDKEFEHEEDQKDYQLVECGYRAFKRSFLLPPSVEQKKLKQTLTKVC